MCKPLKLARGRKLASIFFDKIRIPDFWTLVDKICLYLRDFLFDIKKKELVPQIKG